MTNVYTKKSRNTWNSIAKSFDSTRRKTWKECIDFIDSLPKNSVVADIGSGNGRHLIPCAQRVKKVIGIDVSDELLKIVQKKVDKNNLKNVELVQSDAVDLPLKDNSVDAVLFIATLHNIQKKHRRIMALEEVRRILKPEGKAIISVWSRWQDKFRQDFIKRCFFRYERKEFGDIKLHWKQHGLNVPRFYHLYSKREFVKDLKEAGLRIIEIKSKKISSKKYSDNFFAYVKKK